MKLFVAEDEPDLNRLLQKRLRNENHTVDACTDGNEAWYYLESGLYDVVLLDIMLPGTDGLSLLKRMRRNGDCTPVLLLTARDQIEDRVAGLDAGADDYLVKPFSFEELIARIRALGRRLETQNASDVFTLADLTVNIRTHKVTRADTEIELSGKEFSILEYMIRNKGIVLSRERIEQNSWDFSFEGGSNVVDVYIRYLRRKIDDNFPMKLIHTVRGSGYVLKESL